jgi:hypothetical protein
VVPCFAGEETATKEWRGWFRRRPEGAALDYWLGNPPGSRQAGEESPGYGVEIGEWWIYPQSGIGIRESGLWFLRWDLSPLGYLRTAAHGHLDALHLSVWRGGVALVIDPGTGAYYGDRELRARLASRAAHNGPCPEDDHGPKRLGPFLWSEHHALPNWSAMDGAGAGSVRGEVRVKDGMLARSIRQLTEPDGWEVTDEYVRKGGRGAFTVLWQFGPGTRVEQVAERRYRVQRGEAKIEIEVSEGWAEAGLVEGLVSPAFRQVTMAPGLRLRALDSACVLSTRFLACEGA